MTLVAAAALTALTAAPPADAAAKLARPLRPTEATAPRDAGEPIMEIVSIKSQQVTIYDADGWILRAPVSTGITGRETPAGVFSVVEKDKDHHSSLYDDAWMPNMQRITWSGIALHGGPLPGYAASHGCVRMPYDFAEKLFDKTPIGMRVIIAPNDVDAVEFSHPALFVPNPEALAAAPARAETLAREAEDAAKMLRRGKERRRSSGTRGGVTHGVAAQAGKAQDQRRRRTHVRRQGARRCQDGPSQDAGRGPEAEGRHQGRRTANAARNCRDRGEDEAEAAAAAQNAAKAAEAKRADAAKAARDAKLALEPVSVFISRATQRLYVRRGTHARAPGGGEMFDTILEVPVTIRNPDKPIGTHVFTAVARTDVGLRWTAVTIDSGDNAKSALDRITIPQDVLDRIAPTALPRSSLIISDEPLNRETNYRTEFVVVLNDQPQGGLAMRRRPSEDGFGSNGWSERDSQYGYARQRSGQYYIQQYFQHQQGTW